MPNSPEIGRGFALPGVGSGVTMRERLDSSFTPATCKYVALFITIRGNMHTYIHTCNTWQLSKHMEEIKYI